MDDNHIDLIISQTNYDYETAKIKLSEFNNDYMKVIKNYLGIEEKKTSNKSLNQQIFL